MNSGINSIGNEWKESSAGACLSLVESDTEKHEFMCKITDIRYLTKVPSLMNVSTKRNWESLIPNTASDFLIFSGVRY